MSVGVGDEAPAFSLLGTGGRSYSLEEYRGHQVLLAFYPGDDSPVCTAQLNNYTHEVERFAELDMQVIGISPQSVESHEKFAEKHGFVFPLLADVGKTVGEAYGIVGPLGFYRRSVFVVDAAGLLSYVHRSATGLTFKKPEDILRAVAGR